MLHLESVEELDQLITNENFVLLYISTPTCNVCKVLLPKIDNLLKKFPNIKSRYIDATKFPELQGRFLVFAVPTIIGFITSKETFRESRNISLEVLEEKIDRYYSLIFEE